MIAYLYGNAQNHTRSQLTLSLRTFVKIGYDGRCAANRVAPFFFLYVHVARKKFRLIVCLLGQVGEMLYFPLPVF